jgi:hypothetical protein
LGDLNAAYSAPNRTVIPIQFGHCSDLIRTGFRELFGQFFGTVGTVSEMGRNGTAGVE